MTLTFDVLEDFKDVLQHALGSIAESPQASMDVVAD
jgi:hypothetical protein